LLPLLIAFLLPQALLLVWLGLWLLVILITVFSLRNKVFFSRIFPDFQTGSASLAPPAGERGVASNRCLSPLGLGPKSQHWVQAGPPVGFDEQMFGAK
jgi:hypothetical protein